MVREGVRRVVSRGVPLLFVLCGSCHSDSATRILPLGSLPLGSLPLESLPLGSLPLASRRVSCVPSDSDAWPPDAGCPASAVSYN